METNPAVTVTAAAPPRRKKRGENFSDIFRLNVEVPDAMSLKIGIFWFIVVISLWSSWPGRSVIPKPIEIARAWGYVWSQQYLAEHMLKSLFLYGLSLVIAASISLILAYACKIPLFRPLVYGISVMRYFSMVGLTIIFTLMAADLMHFKISLIVFGMSTYFIASMAAIVVSVPKFKLDDARTLRMNEWQVLYHVIIRGERHNILEVLRQNAAMGWVMLVLVEGHALSQGGVGALLINQHKSHDMDNMYATQWSIFMLGLISDLGFKYYRLAVCPYMRKKKGGQNYGN